MPRGNGLHIALAEGPVASEVLFESRHLHHVDIAYGFAFGFKTTRRANLIHVTVQIELEQIARIVTGPTRLRCSSVSV
jgi:hypothetical protein